MIDIGLPNIGKELLDDLCKNSIAPMNIDYIILPHAHTDQVGNESLFHE